MRLMDISAPRVKKPMPSTSRPAPTRKDSISPLSMGISAKHSSATITVIGSTEAMASLSFSLMIFLLYNSRLLYRHLPLFCDYLKSYYTG